MNIKHNLNIQKEAYTPLWGTVTVQIRGQFPRVNGSITVWEKMPPLEVFVLSQLNSGIISLIFLRVQIVVVDLATKRSKLLLYSRHFPVFVERTTQELMIRVDHRTVLIVVANIIIRDEIGFDREPDFV